MSRGWRFYNLAAEIAAGLAILIFIALLAVLYTASSPPTQKSSFIDINSSSSSLFSIKNSQNSTSDSANGTVVKDDDNEEEDEEAWEPSQSNFFPTKGGVEDEENNDDVAYVVLAKDNQNSYEDPLDKFSESQRHDSGNFRHSKNKVWDPHPQYRFRAFGQYFHLNLKEDASFVPAGVTVTRIGNDSSNKSSYPARHFGCFYTGILNGDDKSSVSVNLCHGMTGHIKTSKGNFLIKPTQNWTSASDQTQPLQHLIYRLSPTSRTTDKAYSISSNDLVQKADNGSHECGLIDHIGEENEVIIGIDDASESAKIYVGDTRGESAGKKIRMRRQLAEVPSGRLNHRNNTASSSSNNDEDDASSFALEEDDDDDEEEEEDEESEYWKVQRGRKSFGVQREYFIEIMVVADQKMITYHGRSLTSYILVLMNTVSRIYKDSSIGNPISIAVTKIKQIDEIFGSKEEGSDGIGAAEMLKKFCRWQKSTDHTDHHDAALLLTRENLCHNPGQKRCDTLGLAELGRMCSLGSSCAIVQDNGLATAFTIAHEIGHVLNMPHDDDPKCGRFRGDSPTEAPHNIMSRMLDDNTVPWEWSKCSRHYVTEFLDSGMANCLLDEPRVDRQQQQHRHRQTSQRTMNRLPGEDYTKNEQCELVYGKGSVICPHHMSSDVCKRLWCTVPDWNNGNAGKEQCHTQHMPWADGTSCGDQDKWCHRGECVSSSSRKNFEPVDGQWGEWSRYGECSRSCGGGIKKKYRECNKPAPKNGGNYCVGERIRYRSCATEECSASSMDFREQQCALYDNDNRNIRNLPKSGLKWHAKYTRLLPEDRCKLYCQVAGNQYYMLRDKVVDGTTCGPDTHHVCVNGQCKPAGCDHVLNSRAELDACGVCRGDNSTCRIVSGSYNSSEYGYSRITEIPAGSSYIDVRQRGWRDSHNDSNYLALRLKNTGKYILNGDFMVMHRKLILHPGVTIDYSGPDGLIERLNSSRPIRVDLVLEVLSVGEVNPPQISYEYTVPTKLLNKYSWSLGPNWSGCDRMCQGVRYLRANCLDPESKELVSVEYCPREGRPQDKTQSCNNHCQLRWGDSGECLQVFSPTQRRKLPEYACYHLKRPVLKKYTWRYGEWTNCSVSCGTGSQIRNTIGCFDEDDKLGDDEHCRHLPKAQLNRSCDRGSCPEWTLSEWSTCSVSCGFGKRHRTRYCRLENRIVEPEICRSVAKNSLDVLAEACDAGACPVWQTGEWSSCSVTCGDGIRRRSVVCRASNGSMSDYCDAASKPINLISCALESCPSKNRQKKFDSTGNTPTSNYSLQFENEIDSHENSLYSKNSRDYTWIVEGFKKCSKRCGGGYAYQIIKCINTASGKEVYSSQEYCEPGKRPKDIIACNEHQCPFWKIGSWTQCDVRCGDGYQHRQVLCQNLRGEIMNDSDCSEKSRPRNLKRCTRPEPCGYNYNGTKALTSKAKWHAGPWSECSVSCGSGVRRREVSCRRVNSFGWFETTLPPENCSNLSSIDSKPVDEQACETRGCNDQHYWTTGPWKKCSQSCGRKGRQIRRLFCLRDSSPPKKVGRLNCPKGLRPHRKRKCNQRPCTGPTSCLEVKAKLKSDTDGEYGIFLGGGYARIYCHDMKGKSPREYLSLPAGERENYSEVYGKRLRQPNECPYAGRRNDSCECLGVEGTEDVSGRTMFHKVRLDVRTLEVIGDDFEFSMRMGSNNIEYGHAGDCYSKVNCPQGRFGINLSGTPFVLDPRIQWQAINSSSSSTYSVIHKINDQRIVGKCGGYCGFCAPQPGIKLNLLFP